MSIESCINKVNAGEAAGAQLKYKAFWQSHHAVPMAQKLADHRSLGIDLKKGVCLGLSVSFLKYKMLKLNVRWLEQQANPGPDVQSALEQLKAHFDSLFPQLKEKRGSDPAPRPRFVRNVEEVYEPHEGIVDTMAAQAVRLKELSRKIHDADWATLYKEIGAKELGYLNLDPAALSSHANWPQDAKLVSKTGYHLVHAPHHAMAMVTNVGTKHAYFDPDGGMASGVDYRVFAKFLREYLDGAYGGDWSIYSFFQ